MSISSAAVERETSGISRQFNLKNIFSDVLIYGSGNILIKGMSLISAPIFTRLFDPEQYGAWSFITALIAFITGILLLGGDTAYTRYYFQCKTDEERKTLTSTWFIFLSVWSYLIVLMILPFSRSITEFLLADQQYHLAWIVALIASPLVMLNLLFSQALRNQFKARAFTILNVVTAALTLLLSVFFTLYFNLGIVGALFGAGLASLLMIPVRIWVIRKLLAWRFSLDQLKKLLSYGAPLVPFALAFWLFSNADRVMLVQLTSWDEVGLYSISTAMAAMLMLLHTAIGQSWLPHAVKLYEEDPDRAAHFFGRVLNYFVAGIGIIVITFVTLAQEVLYILVPPAYYSAFLPIPYLAMGIMFFITAHVSGVGILVKNKTVYIMLACWIVAAVNIGLNYLFIPLWGITGAGLSTGVSYLIFAVSCSLISTRLWRIVYYPGVLFKLLSVVAVAVVFVTIITGGVPGLWTAFGLKVVVLLASSALICAIMASAEKIPVRDYWRKFKSNISDKMRSGKRKQEEG